MSKQQELIEAVRKGESVRIIRGEVDGMKVFEWIEKNLPEVRLMSTPTKPLCEKEIEYRYLYIGYMGFPMSLTFSIVDVREAKYTFQASDLLDYDRQGPIIERHGKHWQEVVPGQIIRGEVECLLWNENPKHSISILSGVSSIIPKSQDGYNWIVRSGWNHLALPVAPPAPKKITMSELMELVGDVLKEKIGGEFEIVGDGV